jgi:hypothetical protein
MAKLLEARGVQPSTTHNNRLTQILLLLSINMHFAAPAITSAKLCPRSINLDFFLNADCYVLFQQEALGTGHCHRAGQPVSKPKARGRVHSSTGF